MVWSGIGGGAKVVGSQSGTGGGTCFGRSWEMPLVIKDSERLFVKKL